MAEQLDIVVTGGSDADRRCASRGAPAVEGRGRIVVFAAAARIAGGL